MADKKRGRYKSYAWRHPQTKLPYARVQIKKADGKYQTILKPTKNLEGKVVGISDGDTITVLDSTNKQWKIQLEGIDAPESKQDFGDKAKQNLSSLVYDKNVQIITGKTDKYGCTVGKVLVDGLDVNLEQIKAGFVWHYKHISQNRVKLTEALP